LSSATDYRFDKPDHASLHGGWVFGINLLVAAVTKPASPGCAESDRGKTPAALIGEHGFSALGASQAPAVRKKHHAVILVRPRAWWFNKVPLSVTLLLLLLDGRPVSVGSLAVLALLVLTICAVGNYGYALDVAPLGIRIVSRAYYTT
jgi:hypothetical protein